LPPVAAALLALFAGWGLACAGVYLLAGLGWVLVFAGVPFVVVSLILFRGLIHAIDASDDQ
jgi:hypothetical protein